MNGILTKSTKLQRVQKKYSLTTEGRTHLRQKIRTQINTKKNHYTKPYKTYGFKADVQQNDKTYRNVLDGPSVKTAREFNITGSQTCRFFFLF